MSAHGRRGPFESRMLGPPFLAIANHPSFSTSLLFGCFYETLHNWEQTGKKYRRLECAAMDDNERGFFRRMKRDESHDFSFLGRDAFMLRMTEGFPPSHQLKKFNKNKTISSESC
jgi:hypothetical protein